MTATMLEQQPDAASANPLGLNGFEFVEFTSPEPDRMAASDSDCCFMYGARAMPGCITMSCKYASTRSTSACTARVRRAARARARHRDAYRRRQGRRAIAWRRDRSESDGLHNRRRHNNILWRRSYPLEVGDEPPCVSLLVSV